MERQQFVVVIHTEDGPGNSRVYGPFDSMREAGGSVPRIMSVNPDGVAAEVVAVTDWHALDTDPDLLGEDAPRPAMN